MARAGSIIARDDTLLGVCFALGEDFGFNPVYLRVPLGAIVLWSLPLALAAYAALGLLVALSRWMAPNPPSFADEEPESPCGEAPAEWQEELPLAA
jgi:phage shock protein C